LFRVLSTNIIMATAPRSLDFYIAPKPAVFAVLLAVNPNPYPKPLLVAEKSHHYPTPCAQPCEGEGGCLLYAPEDLLNKNVSYT
jgi:hypothetical protein